MGTAATADRNRFRIGNATNQTAFIGTVDNANLVGGGGAAATKIIDIVPWAIGETLTAGLADINMGNSLVTYVSGTGFRALDFTTEYNTFATKATDTDNIRESLTADLTGLAGTTLNALVLNNASAAANTINVTGTGASQTLQVTSGALLFTRDTAGAGAYGITLGGFNSGITMGGAGITNEYVIHVVNPDSASATKTLTATISSNLTSTADITKSGRGILVLSGTNTAGGGISRSGSKTKRLGAKDRACWSASSGVTGPATTRANSASASARGRSAVRAVAWPWSEAVAPRAMK
jgi:hypothetical protein